MKSFGWHGKNEKIEMKMQNTPRNLQHLFWVHTPLSTSKENTEVRSTPIPGFSVTHKRHAKRHTIHRVREGLDHWQYGGHFEWERALCTSSSERMLECGSKERGKHNTDCFSILYQLGQVALFKSLSFLCGKRGKCSAQYTSTITRNGILLKFRTFAWY